MVRNTAAADANSGRRRALLVGGTCIYISIVVVVELGDDSSTCPSLFNILASAIHTTREGNSSNYSSNIAGDNHHNYLTAVL
jgi:hypothetical protein